MTTLSASRSAERPSGVGEDHAGHHAVAAAGQQRQAGADLFRGFGFGQNAAAERDHGIGGEHEAAGTRCGVGLGAGHPARVQARGFVACRGFVDVGGDDAVGREADLVKQHQATRAG